MKLSDIKIGRHVGVNECCPIEPSENRLWGTDTKIGDVIRSGAKVLNGYVPAVVLDVGIPYKTGRSGVRIELTYESKDLRRCRCSQCGADHYPPGDDTEDAYVMNTVTKEATVHSSALHLWSDLLIRDLVDATV